jgi:hypothetical protein
MEKLVFASQEIFEDIPGDPDNVVMRIPPEILEKTGWQEGDELQIEIEDDAIVITKV